MKALTLDQDLFIYRLLNFPYQHFSFSRVGNRLPRACNRQSTGPLHIISTMAWYIERLYFYAREQRDISREHEVSLL